MKDGRIEKRIHVVSKYMIASGHTRSAKDGQYCKSESDACEYTLVMLLSSSEHTVCLHVKVRIRGSTVVAITAYSVQRTSCVIDLKQLRH
jgi:hypothetical protein